MWKIETPYRKFHLPPENDFIARDFKLYPKDENETKNPSLIHESSISQIWFKRDDEFELPTLHTKFILYSPVTCMNPNNMNLNMIFVELFKEKFTIYGYSAILAGFQYTVQPINCGILVHLFGYHEKLSLLLEKLISEIILFKFDKNRFEVAKEARIRKLENFDSDRLYNQANSYYSQYLIDSFGYSTEDYLATTKILQAHDMDMFMKRVFSRIFIQGFIYGNSDKQLAMKLVDILEDPFKSRSVVLPQELSFSRGLKIEEGSNLVYERSNKYHSNSCYYAFFQIGPGQTFVDIVLTELFVTIVREKCYKVLRTEDVALGDVYTFRNSSSFFPPEIQHLDIAPLGTKI